jgi:hypothetical protein
MTDLPRDSRLWSYWRSGDFLDCYTAESPLPARRAAEVIVAFPKWTGALLLLRNLLVLPFGLKGGTAKEPRIGIFPIDSETPDELIAGFDDRHLDFRVAVLAGGGRVHCATWVHPHNAGGRAYLRAVLPFHRAIMRSAMRRLARASPPAV